MTSQELRDSWWLNCDGVTVKQPMMLNALERQFQENPGAQYLVLHADEASNPNPDWKKLEGRRRPPPSNSRPSFKMPKPSAAEVELPESDELVAPSPLTPKVMARLDTIEASQRETLAALRELCFAVKEIGAHLSTSNGMQERERYVNEAEDRLVAETHRLEVERAELEQMRAELTRGKFTVVGA